MPTSTPEQNGIFNLALDLKGRIWGDNWNWLSIYDSNVKTTNFRFENHLIDYSIYDFSKERMVPIYLKYPSLRNLWAGYQQGGRTLDILSGKAKIYTLNRDSCFFIDINSLTYKSVKYSLYDKQSGLVSGVKLRIDKKNQFLYVSNYSYDKNGSAILQYDLDKGTFKKFIIPDSIRMPIQYAEFPWYDIDDSGNIWVASSRGVIVYEPYTFKRIYSYEKRNRGTVKQLINITDKGVMCIMSETGIELYNYVNNRSINLSVGDGLYSNSFQIGAYANNMLFVSYPGYLQYIPIDSVLNKKENRFCYLSELYVGKENRLFFDPDSEENINLNHNENDLTLIVSTTEFNQPQRLQYRYMLEGSDNDWNYSNFENKSITYRNLVPGTYTYKAVIKNSDGTWSNNEFRIKIVIQPAFWQTMWFKLIYIAVFLLLTYLFYRRRIITIRNDEQKRSTHEKELIELEAKALRAQMNPHFIFNCLNSIKSLIQEHQEEKSVTYLTTFSKLIRNLFNSADKKEISLYDEIETCKLYLKLEAMRFDTRFSYAVNVDENIDLKSVQVRALIVQPFIENAIWHGIVPSKSGGHLALNVLRNNGVIEIVIDDNGIGREASSQNKSPSGLAHQSKGVNLTQSRLELNNLLQQRQAKLEIIDKKNENDIATGTKIIISIREET